MPKGRLVTVVLVILAVLVAGEILLPYIIGSMVARGMAGHTGSQQVTAEVSGRPAWLMLDGRFGSIHIAAAEAKVDKIVLTDLDARLSRVAIDMGELVVRGQVVVKAVKDIDLSAAITQEELSRYLNQNVKGVKNAQVTVDAGKVKVASTFVIGQIASVAITLEGRVAGDGQKLKFVTERFLLNNTAVGNIGGTVLTEIQLVDLKKLPFPVSVRQVGMERGRVTIAADNRAAAAP